MILLILKILGILLLTIFCIVLFLLLTVLFCPIVYEGKGEKDSDSYKGYAKVSWLFHIISFRVLFSKEENVTYVFKIFGISPKKIKNAFKRNKQHKKNQVAPCKEEKVEPIQKSTNKPVLDDVTDPVSKPLLEKKEKKAYDFSKIYDKIKKAKRFIESKRYERLKVVFIENLKKIFLHIRPKKLHGRVRFGTEDPCYTGEILAVLGIFYSAIGEHVSIEADFQEKVLEGNLYLKGRVYSIFFIVTILKLMFDQDVRYMIKKVKQS